MSIEKVRRYEAEVLTHPSGYPARVAMVAYDTGRYIEYADHARIVAEKDAEIDRLHELNRQLCREGQQMEDLLAKYQRLHAADVAWDKANYDYHINGVENYDEIERTAEMRRLAMEAIK